MVTIHEEPDCGNAPRKQVLRDFVVAIAQHDLGHLVSVLAEEVSWTLVGERKVTGREATQHLVLGLPPVDELTFGTFLTHGRGAGVDGVLRLADGTRMAFCHMLRFPSPVKTARIIGINSYFIKIPAEA